MLGYSLCGRRGAVLIRKHAGNKRGGRSRNAALERMSLRRELFSPNQPELQDKECDEKKIQLDSIILF